MKITRFRFTGFVMLLGLALPAFSDPAPVVHKRWTRDQIPGTQLDQVLQAVQKEGGPSFTQSQFILVEERALATSYFKNWALQNQGIPVQGQGVRVWSDLRSGQGIQVEADLGALPEPGQSSLSGASLLRRLRLKLQGSELRKKVLDYLTLNQFDDLDLVQVSFEDTWSGPTLMRTVTARSKHGKYRLSIDLVSEEVKTVKYSPFGHADLEIPALVYPIYEEFETGHGTQVVTERKVTTLRGLLDSVKDFGQDPFSKLREGRHYWEGKQNALASLTPSGQSKGFWSMQSVYQEGLNLIDGFLPRPNRFDNGGVLLQGRFATINLHPSWANRAGDLQFPVRFSSQIKGDFVEGKNASGESENEMVPRAGLLGKPLASQDEGMTRPARRLSDHSPTQYLNDGFDELQVYYAVDTLFQSLQNAGWSDPDLSQRPFNAFLYDTDITMRNNAYYTDDTINFTTYSPDAPNFARDNPTIWHELGHGVMDRMMGPYLNLADTGGLSEGMADFIAQLVVESVTGHVAFPGSGDFRIMNNTGFFLTNEVHDDGEAYGGAMHDLLDAAINRYGQEGVRKVIDLTLEAMRFARNNPALTAQDWFNRMLFADERGMPGLRQAGEMRGLILQSVEGRNFAFDTGTKPADLTISYTKAGETTPTLLTSESIGSRERPIALTLKSGQSADYNLEIGFEQGTRYQLPYPIRVKVAFNGSALQGAVHWQGEENGAVELVLTGPGQKLYVPLKALGCETFNWTGGMCKDYAQVRLFVGDETKPRAKKRFYLKIKPEA